MKYQPRTGNLQLVICIVFSIITFAVVLARTWARLFVIRHFGLDDWLCLFAFALAVALAVLSCVGEYSPSLRLQHVTAMRNRLTEVKLRTAAAWTRIPTSSRPRMWFWAER